ncbi:MAG: alpha-mannosidase [Lachnotalea sp.]
MAFVQVVRRSMRPEEYTDLRFEWLKRFLYESKYEITDIQVRDARQISENEFDYYPEGYRVLKKGDIYFTPDGTAFFKANVTIPTFMQGKEVWLSMWTAAEIIAKVNGKYVGGMDPNRERTLLSPYIDRNELVIEMEGYNRSKPDDERNPDAMMIRGCRQEFQGLYLSTVNHQALDLFYDLQILLDIAKSDYFNEDYRKFLNKEINHALNKVDFDAIKECIEEDVNNLCKDAEKYKEINVGIQAAIHYIEAQIYSNTDFKGSGNVALVGHSHLDIAYYWRKIHAVQKNARTVLIQMRLMDRYPDFRYTHTQAYTYELLEKYYPELFEELKEKIAAGNFEPVGAMYIEPDCNIPSAESLIRQCLYGQQYFREKFNKTVNNAWLPDVFGNSWILPQILRKSGVEYFVSNKMSTWNDTNRFPHNNFIWKGIDGTPIYACVPPTHFITWNMPSQIQENWEAYQDKETGGQTLSMFGYGDGGSGATEEMMEMMNRFDKLSIMPKTEQVSGAKFLEDNLKGNEQLSVWDGELYLEMHRGTFTTKSNLKRENRQLEFALREAEVLEVLRFLSGEAYPADEMRDAYKKFLVNQFHDILPGSHIHPVYEDAMNDYKEVRIAVNQFIGQGLTYFNSLNFTRNSLTFVEKEDGKIIRCGKKGYFIKPDLAAFATIDVLDSCEKPRDKSWLVEHDLEVETPYYKIQFAEDGSIESLFDKEQDREWVDGAFNKLHIFQDLPGMYDAWDILPNYKDKELSLNIEEPLHLVSIDNNCATYEVLLGTKVSKWNMQIRLFANSRDIEVENIVDWQEKHKLAKMEFGMNVVSRELVCDTSAGYIKRETHKNTTWQQARFEVCMHKWCDMSETDGGVAIINDGKYGVGVDENKITLSLLRATIRPDITSDMGHHDFCYKIVPHAGNHINAEINRIAYEYNVPLLKVNIPEKKDESLSAILNCISQKKSLYLQALKLSEDKKKVIIRVTEQDGTRGKLTLPCLVQPVNLLEDVEGKQTDHMEYKPFEILSFALEVASEK